MEERGDLITEPEVIHEETGKKKKNRNIFERYSQKFTKTQKFIFVAVVMTSIQCLSGYFPILLNSTKGNNKPNDIAFLMLLRSFIPTILFFLFSILMEGTIASPPPPIDIAILCGIGFIMNGLFPFICYYCALYINPLTTSIYGNLLPLCISIGSYIFKLEPLPNLNNKPTIGIFIGMVTTVSFSIALIVAQYSVSVKITVTSWIVLATVGSAALVLNAININYQVVRFVLNKDSVFYNRPMGVMGYMALYSTPITFTIFGVACGVRYHSVYDTMVNPYAWIAISIGMLIVGFFNNAMVAVCNIFTTPLFVSNFSSLSIFFACLFAYFLSNKTFTNNEYFFAFMIIFGLIIMSVSKNLSKPKTYDSE